MSNAELIERLRTSDGDFGLTMDEAAAALELADKRIAELEAKDMRFSRREPTALRYQLDEAERKLAVAREALKAAEWNSLDLPEFVRVEIAEALAQIGGEDAR